LFRLFVLWTPFTVLCPIPPNTPSGQLTPSMLQSKFMILLLQHHPGSSTSISSPLSSIPHFTVLFSPSASYPQDHFQPPFSLSLVLLPLAHIHATNQEQYSVQQWHMHSLLQSGYNGFRSSPKTVFGILCIYRVPTTSEQKIRRKLHSNSEIRNFTFRYRVQ